MCYFMGSTLNQGAGHKHRQRSIAGTVEQGGGRKSRAGRRKGEWSRERDGRAEQGEGRGTVEQGRGWQSGAGRRTVPIE